MNASTEVCQLVTFEYSTIEVLISCFFFKFGYIPFMKFTSMFACRPQTNPTSVGLEFNGFFTLTHEFELETYLKPFLSRKINIHLRESYMKCMHQNVYHFHRTTNRCLSLSIYLNIRKTVQNTKFIFFSLPV